MFICRFVVDRHHHGVRGRRRSMSPSSLSAKKLLHLLPTPLAMHSMSKQWRSEGKGARPGQHVYFIFGGGVGHFPCWRRGRSTNLGSGRAAKVLATPLCPGCINVLCSLSCWPTSSYFLPQTAHSMIVFF